MASVSPGWFRAAAVCLLLLAAAASTGPLDPLNAAASSCSQPDPFAAVGGGVCLNGGWLPKGMVTETQVPGLPAAPLPTVPAGPSVQHQSCATPDPFAALGGGTCHNGGWLPPGIMPPAAAPPPAAPVPSVPASQPPPATPIPANHSSCSTPDPFSFIGGGSCVNGGWVPRPASSSPAPLPVTPPPTDAPDVTCATPDPFASLGGGTCHQGGWLPPGAGGTPAEQDPSSAAPPQVEFRITGTVGFDAGRRYIQTGTGGRYVMGDEEAGLAQFDGLVVTARGLLARPPASDAGEIAIASVRELAVLPTAMPSPEPIPLVDDRLVTVRSATEVAARRSALAAFVWGDAGLPLASLPTVLRDDSSPVPDLENLQQVHTLVMTMDGGRSGYAHHFVPRRSNNRAVVLHHGHACTFADSSGGDDAGLGMQRTLNTLLVHGYSVVAVYMPNHARFSTTQVEVDDCVPYSHYGMFAAPHGGSGSPLQFFLTPTTMALNYLQDEHAYEDLSMVGLSGGGWTTTVYAALDPRITTSIHVGGTLPLYLQRTDIPGDSEQVLEPFYRVAGYPELYVLGGAGPGRRQLQILNRQDECCFSERQSNVGPGAAFDGAVRGYEREVRAALAAIDGGAFRVEIDEAAPGHMISWNSVLNYILPELNGGQPHVAAASPDAAFIRGVNGHLWHFDAGVWRDTGLPMVGTPAVVEGAVHAFDLFYRSSGNRLMHAFPLGSGWEARDLGIVVLSDPAAASWGPGRIDVVSVDTAYRPIHWSSDAGAVQTRIISSANDALSAGRPALVTTGPGHLHAFVQGRFDRAVHVLQLGPDLAWQSAVLPSTLLDAPAAVVDAGGTVRAYFRGASSALWEVANIEGAWKWTHVTAAVGGRMIRGVPSASRFDGGITVHARTATGLATFRLTDGWTLEEAAGSVLGSPTSTHGVAHLTGGSHDVWLYAAAWTSRGRPTQ